VYGKIIELLDSKVNLSLRQILPPTYIISFAKGNTTIILSRYNIARDGARHFKGRGPNNFFSQVGVKVYI
jgi:hypothetical protein